MAQIVDFRKHLPAPAGFAATATTAAIWRLFECCMADSCAGLLVGVLGVSKTSAAHAYRDQNPDVLIVTMGRRHAADHAALYNVLEAVSGGAAPPARSTADVHRLALELLRPPPFQAGRSLPPLMRPEPVDPWRPSLLIVDEATYLDQAAADCVANLAEQAGIGLVFIGNLDLHQRWFPARAADRLCAAQFAARFGLRLVLDRVPAEDVAPIVAGCGISGQAQVAYLTRIATGFSHLHGVRHVLKAAAHLGSWPPTLDQLKSAAAMCGLER